MAQRVAELEASLRAEPIVATEPLQLWLLARQLDCYAVVIDHPVRQQKKNRQVLRSWSAIADDVNKFSAAVSGTVDLSNGISKEDLRMLANYSTETSTRETFMRRSRCSSSTRTRLSRNLLTLAGRWIAKGETQVLAGFSEKLVAAPPSSTPSGEDATGGPKTDPNHRRLGMIHL